MGRITSIIYTIIFILLVVSSCTNIKYKRQLSDIEADNKELGIDNRQLQQDIRDIRILYINNQFDLIEEKLDSISNSIESIDIVEND